MNKKGQALIVVVAFLTMLFVVGLAFYTLSQAERTSSLRHLDSLKARYIAEAGVAYAQKVLNIDRETNLIDSLEDITFIHFQGQDVDVDGDGTSESRWFDVSDSQGNLFGRFSLKVYDEASKMHLNLAPKDNLEKLFAQLGAAVSGVDALLAKRPFNALEEAGAILKREGLNLTKDFLTVYSRDAEVDLRQKRRAYLNSASAQVILEAFLERGIRDAYQKAANLKDATDANLTQTILDKFSLDNIAPSGLLEAGSWQKIGNFYEAPAGGIAGKFIWSNLAVEDAEYFCFLYGPQDTDVVGEVSLSLEDSGQPIICGEGLINKVKVDAGSFSLYIKPAKDAASRISYIELISLSSKNGLNRKTIRGSEALVINEIMVKPRREISIGAVDIPSGQSFHQVFTQLKAGNYYVVVKAVHSGGIVGDVSINGQAASKLYDGDYFPYGVKVEGDGALSIDIKNNTLGKTSFAGITILQEPDAEFIELLNVSSQAINLGNFFFEVYSPTGELMPGWPARIPEDIMIQPYQYLIFTVDNGDTSPSPSQLRNNNVSFQKLWGFNAVGLIFEEYLDSINRSFDLLPNKGARIILKNASAETVDAAEYEESQVKDFLSLERPDPAAKTDADNDGLFDGWYTAAEDKQATPASANDNSGMYTQDTKTGKWLKHDPSEIKVFNHNISNLSEVQELSSGKNWKKFTLLDLARMSDRFAYEALEFGLSGHYKSGKFKENGSVFEALHKEDSGVWEFLGIPSGSYLLSIISDDQNFSGGKIRVAIKTDEQEDFGVSSSLLFSQGAALFGVAELTEEQSLLQLKIVNDTEAKLTLKEIRLEPVSYSSGRININTAGKEVLASILNSDILVQAVLKNRPFGVKDGRRLGIGELFLLEANFLSLHNLLAVKSDIYKIDCKGEYLPVSKIPTYQIIHSVVERGK